MSRHVNPYYPTCKFCTWHSKCHFKSSKYMMYTSKSIYIYTLEANLHDHQARIELFEWQKPQAKLNKVLLRKLWTKKPDKSKLPTLRKICNITFPWVTSTGSFSTSMEKLCTETGQVAEKSKVCREGDAASAVDASSPDFLRIQKGDKMIFIYRRVKIFIEITST